MSHWSGAKERRVKKGAGQQLAARKARALALRAPRRDGDGGRWAGWARAPPPNPGLAPRPRCCGPAVQQTHDPRQSSRESPEERLEGEEERAGLLQRDPSAADVRLHEGREPGSQRLSGRLFSRRHRHAHGVLLVHVFQGFPRSRKAENQQGFSNHFTERNARVGLGLNPSRARRGCPSSGRKGGFVALLPPGDALWDPLGLGASPGGPRAGDGHGRRGQRCRSVRGAGAVGGRRAGGAIRGQGPPQATGCGKGSLAQGEVLYRGPSSSSSFSAWSHLGFEG